MMEGKIISDQEVSRRFDELGSELLQELGKLMPAPLGVFAAQFLPRIKAAMLTDEGRATITQLIRKISYTYGYEALFVPEYYATIQDTDDMTDREADE